ncbi:MAG: hypothetical protein KAX49_14070 [Halanaerobiales bacterium]|nr:hypothetical protein [Halanaerobiales bacterium]
MDVDNKIINNLKETAITFYRMEVHKEIANFSNKKKHDILQEISDLSLREPFWLEHLPKFIIKSYDVNYKFKGLELMAWMYELGNDLLHIELSEETKINIP